MKLNPLLDEFVENALLINQPKEYLDKRGFNKNDLLSSFSNVCRKLFSQISEKDDDKILVRILQEQTRTNSNGSDLKALIELAKHIRPSTQTEDSLQNIVYGLLWGIKNREEGDLSPDEINHKKDNIKESFRYLVDHVFGRHFCFNDGDIDELNQLLH